MKPFYSTILFLFFALPMYAIDFFPGTYQQALLKAKTEDKQVLLYFTATWCGPCQYMQQMIFPDASITNYVTKNFVALKLDIDTEKGKRVYLKFKNVGIPDFYIINPDEVILKHLVGGVKLKQFKEFISNVGSPSSMMKPVSDVAALTKDSQLNAADDSVLKLPSDLTSGAQIRKPKPDSIADREYQIIMSRKPSRFMKMYYVAMFSKWKPGVSLGIRLNDMDHSERHYLPGYQFTYFMDYRARKFYFQPGLQFGVRSGSFSGIKHRLHHLDLPLVTGFKIGTHQYFQSGKQPIWFNVIPYAGLNLWSTKQPDAVIASGVIPEFGNFNYGAKLGFSLTMGSFMPSVGYDIGRYNQTYYLSFALILGK
ncbi:thioredoxin family protein [Pedobacter metabolipauper]|uniref:Thioredoxin-like protein n=1 Tax=Pedobacter metabolipauper TaxID=425513 RepID=A0A4R6SZ23_9SPHI|nr:thioredoxin family protein [Pedobacter metabolipauper]TDQ11874.1 thioredoxin-like protein [Pedobacter metabolipauper]